MKLQWRVWFLLFIFFGIPVYQVHSFDTYVIHPKLAGVITSLFNEQYPEDLLDHNEIEWLTQGTIEEDEPIIRAFNHFYNPLNRQGLRIAGIKLGLPSPEWSLNSAEQTSSEGGDCSWQTAVNAYKNNDIPKGLRCLGHTLHLLEDVGVPAHTRNDQHAFGDPFEEWGKYNNPLVSSVINNIEPICKKADDCIIELATWVNSNFFSKDTITSKDFPAPMNRAIREDMYLMDNSRKLAAYNPKNKSYYLSQEIQREYWQEISPMIIRYGLRLLEVFFIEVGVLDQNVIEEKDLSTQSSPDFLPQINQPGTPMPTTPSNIKEKKSSSIPPQKISLEKTKKPVTPPQILGITKITNPPISLSNQPSVKNSSKLPDTYILTRPASITNQTSVHFTFSSDILDATFECSADNGNWYVCSSNHRVTNLLEGRYDIYVRAITQEGYDQTPIHYSWTIDITPPITALIPEVGIHSRSATFRFYSEIGAHFECKFDTSSWVECQSPKVYEDLSTGSHSFQVRAFDKVGNREAIASGHIWQVDIDKPQAPIIVFPSSLPFYTNNSTIEIQATTPTDTKLLINGSEDNIYKRDDNWLSEQLLSNGENIFKLTSKNIYGEISDSIDVKVIQDNTTPTAIIENLPENYDQLQFFVNWRGFDNDSENLRYDLDFRLAEADWQPWQENIDDLQAEFTVQFLGPPISFRVRARDQAGNISDWSEIATTHYSFNPINHLVISQIVTKGSWGSLDEFIELYNPSSAHINLQGYAVQKKSQLGILWLDSTPLNSLDSITIPPYGYILISGKDYSYETIPDIRITTEIAYDENGHIRIVNSIGEEIDRLGYGSASNPEGLAAPSPSQSISLQRKAYYSSNAYSLQTHPLEGNGYDSNFNLFDFVLQDVVVPRASHNQAMLTSSNLEEGMHNLWHFDECNGVTFDSLHSITPYQLSSWVVGKYGCASQQNWYSHEQISWELDSAITATEVTISFYMKESGYGSAGTMWLLNSEHNAGIGSKISLYGINPLFNNQEIISGLWSPISGQWYHYTFVYSKNYLGIYIDGYLKKKIIGDFSLNISLSNLTIGQDNIPWKFDEIAVWGRALSSEEILASLSEQLSPHILRPEPTFPQIVHFWNFDNEENIIDLVGGIEIVNPEIIPGRQGNGLHISWQRPLADTRLSTITNKDVSISYWRKRGLTGNGGGAVLITNHQTGRRFGMGGGHGESYYHFNESVEALGSYIPNDYDWHHIALVYDSYLYQVRYYIDGILQSTREQIWFWDSFDTLVVGEQQLSFIIDDLKIWEGALHNQQVSEEAGLVLP